MSRLVGVLEYIRDAERFGFSSLEALDAEGERLIAAVLDLVARYPDIAAIE